MAHFFQEYSAVKQNSQLGLFVLISYAEKKWFNENLILEPLCPIIQIVTGASCEPGHVLGLGIQRWSKQALFSRSCFKSWCLCVGPRNAYVLLSVDVSFPIPTYN